jgi:hypothetical protein
MYLMFLTRSSLIYSRNRMLRVHTTHSSPALARGGLVNLLGADGRCGAGRASAASLLYRGALAAVLDALRIGQGQTSSSSRGRADRKGKCGYQKEVYADILPRVICERKCSAAAPPSPSVPFVAVSWILALPKMAMMMGEDFQYVLRILNTNVDGRQKVMYAMCSIKGIGRRLSCLAPA